MEKMDLKIKQDSRHQETGKAEILKLQKAQEKREKGGKWIYNPVSKATVLVPKGKTVSEVMEKHEKGFKESRISSKNKEEKETTSEK